MEQFIIDQLGLWVFILIPVVCALLTSMITEIVNSWTPKVFSAWYSVAAISLLISIGLTKIFPTFINTIWIQILFIAINFFFTIGFYDKGGRKFIKWAFEGTWLKTLVNTKMNQSQTGENTSDTDASAN